MHQVGKNHLIHSLRISNRSQESGIFDKGTQNHEETDMFGRFCGKKNVVVEKGKVIGRMALGAASAGAIAVGAFALGAMAVGAMAIGRLAIGSARVKRLEIDELIVGKLTVRER
jgi:hypothetical protein